MIKPRLATFFTGCAISMRIDPATGGAAPALSGEEITVMVPVKGGDLRIAFEEYVKLRFPRRGY
jgi:L-asparaginase/Glu-tRNA(Gln) amidotransferase subunit D